MSALSLSEKDVATNDFTRPQFRNALSQQKRRSYSNERHNAIRHERRVWSVRVVLGVVAGTAAGVSSLVINGSYNSSGRHDRGEVEHSTKGSPSSMLRFIETGLNQLLKHKQPQQLPNFIHDPSAMQLLAACMVYSAATNGYYQLHSDDTYQIWIVTCGVASAFAAGWVCGKDAYGALMDFVPWFLMLSMVISTVVHWVMRSSSWNDASKVPDENHYSSEESLSALERL